MEGISRLGRRFETQTHEFKKSQTTSQDKKISAVAEDRFTQKPNAAKTSTHSFKKLSSEQSLFSRAKLSVKELLGLQKNTTELAVAAEKIAPSSLKQAAGTTRSRTDTVAAKRFGEHKSKTPSLKERVSEKPAGIRVPFKLAS